ncbi:hypothetical protein MYP_2345 [Sporocytophaga myxococcoides]|uniref:Uncharacterized protein n=2 Tax=Sporocytophaga myxococcoides TaxID=153721 RepID=A0A098LF69_9BACT|nr:hypothetical protein MYP_2345 [Sporocytophaga myxococcoides]
MKYYKEAFYDIGIDQNGNILTTLGYTFLKIDQQGNILTSKPINFRSENEYSFLMDVQSSYNGAYYAGDYPISKLLKLDSDGNTIWEANSYTTLMLEDLQKNLLASNGKRIIKYSPTGKELWTKNYPFTVASINLSDNNEYKIVGQEGDKIVFSKLNELGDTIYTKKYKTSLFAKSQTSDGNLIATGNNGKIFIISEAGDTLGSNVIKKSYISCIEQTKDGFFLASDNNSPANLTKYDLNCRELWSLDIPSSRILSVRALPDQGFIAACTTFVDGNKTILIRGDKNGKIYSNYIKGKISKDINNNCSLDGNEPKNMSGMLVKTEPENLYAITDESGNYSIAVDTGISYKIIPIINSKIGNQSSSCYPFRTVLFNQKQKDSTGNDFFIKQELNPDLKINYSISNRTRCFTGASTITIANYGFADAENVTVSVEAPSFYFIKEANFPFLKSDKFIQFNVGKIETGKIKTIKLIDSISCIAMLNDVANIRSIVSTTTNCIKPKFCKDTVIIRFSVTGSFDPNDKQVFPSLINFEDYFDGNKELNYLIRFQNTGNGEARTVRVVDTLSSSLDIHSIRSIQTSHGSSTKIISSDPLIIEWLFENINLPYQSQSEELSQGFISFSIDLKDGLEDKTIVSNGAAIYFDYNEPVITNRATTLISSEEETETYKESITTGTQKVSSIHSIILFPNPITESSVIRIAPTLNAFKTAVYDSKGIKLLEKDGSGDEVSIHRSDLRPGIYFYQIYTENQEIGKGSFLVK